MKGFSEYNIAIGNLAEKTHFYEWKGNDKFFSGFPNVIVEKGSFLAKLSLEKSSTMLRLYFEIEGSLTLICDRSLEEFDLPFETTNNLILKLGERNEVLTDEIEIIHRDTEEINVAQYIYEFIGLAIPMKKLHPKFREEETEEDEEGKLIYSSEKDLSDDFSEDENTKTDPRWEILKKLKQ